MKPLLDSDGRLFGRINLVDAAIGAFVVLLVPLAYAAMLMFRAPTPRITSVEMVAVTRIEDRAAQGSPVAGKLKVRGENFRPVLRAQIGDEPAIGFIFENPQSADVLFGPGVPPGTHDLVLLDGVQEVARSPRAVTVPDTPKTGNAKVRVAGVFLNLDEPAARELKAGAKFPASGDTAIELIALGPVEPARFQVNATVDTIVGGRWQRAALAAVRCEIAITLPKDCMADGVQVIAGAILEVPGSALRIWVDEVLPDSDAQPTDARVRFVGSPGVVSLLRAGDRDREHWAIDGRGATIVSLGAPRPAAGDISLGLAQEGYAVSGEVRAPDNVVAVDAVLRLGLDRSRNGWRYRNDLVRAGVPLTFTTYSYTIRGIVLGLTPQSPPAMTTGSSK